MSDSTGSCLSFSGSEGPHRSSASRPDDEGSAAKAVRFADAESPPPYRRYAHPPPPVRTRRYFYARADWYGALLGISVIFALIAVCSAALVLPILYTLGRTEVGHAATAAFVSLFVASGMLAVAGAALGARYSKWAESKRPPKYVYINRRFRGASRVARETRVERRPGAEADGWTADRRVFPCDEWYDAPCRIGDAVDWDPARMPTLEEALGLARA